MGNCCSKELILDDERNINSLKIFYNKNIMKHIGLTPVDYFEGEPRFSQTLCFIK